MTVTVLTIFPGMLAGFLGETTIKHAQEAGALRVKLVNIRDYTTDKHQTTDDTPYGGGPGMVMKIEPIFNALQALKDLGTRRTALLSPRGRQFSQAVAEEYAKLNHLVLICGRYEGVDQRVADCLCDEELSIGPYVLSGGEVAAMVIIEAVSRLVPGVLGNPESLKEESYAPGDALRGHTVEYPQYTKPADFMGWLVPDVLLSGDHTKIDEWRTSMTK